MHWVGAKAVAILLGCDRITRVNLAAATRVRVSASRRAQSLVAAMPAGMPFHL